MSSLMVRLAFCGPLIGGIGTMDKPKIPRYPDALAYHDSPDIVKTIRRQYEIAKDLLRPRWMSEARSPVSLNNSFKLL